MVIFSRRLHQRRCNRETNTESTHIEASPVHENLIFLPDHLLAVITFLQKIPYRRLQTELLLDHRGRNRQDSGPRSTTLQFRCPSGGTPGFWERGSLAGAIAEIRRVSGRRGVAAQHDVAGARGSRCAGTLDRHRSGFEMEARCVRERSRVWKVYGLCTAEEGKSRAGAAWETDMWRAFIGCCGPERSLYLTCGNDAAALIQVCDYQRSDSGENFLKKSYLPI